MKRQTERENDDQFGAQFWRWFKEKWHRFQLGKWLLIVFLSCFLITSVRLVYIAKTAHVRELKNALEQNTVIYDENGNKAGTLYSQKGTWEPLNRISPNMQNAVLSTEDRNFYHEYGFSVKGIGRAALSYVKNRLLGRDYISGGGSTLTQQLVKNAFLSQEQTFSRKAKELFISVQVENDYSKRQIFTMYLNNAYFGKGVWGVEDAAKRYFGVHARDLTVPQAAVLAGMLTNPNGFNPVDHPKAALARRNLVLQFMYENHKLTARQMRRYQRTPIITRNTFHYHSGYRYPYYFDAVISEAHRDYGLSEQQIMNRGYKIYTSLNQNYQRQLQRNFANPDLFPVSQNGVRAQGAAIAMNPKTGGVTAAVGGRQGSHVFRGYNRATQLSRSPASTMKPIAVYLPAIQSGYHYDSMIPDRIESYGSNHYTPHNWNNVCVGKLPLYSALAQSKNTSAVWLLNRIGVQKGYAMAKRFGIPVTKRDENLTLPLGGLSKGVSPYQMAAAYCAFDNGGVKEQPHFITKIVDADGHVVRRKKPLRAKRLMSRHDANVMTSMMIDTYKVGVGKDAKPTGYEIAGKDGTAQATTKDAPPMSQKDSWYIGYTPDVVLATWVGFDNGTPFPITGMRNGTSLFKQSMEDILPYTAGTKFTVTDAATKMQRLDAGNHAQSTDRAGGWSHFKTQLQNGWNHVKTQLGNWGNTAKSYIQRYIP